MQMSEKEVGRLERTGAYDLTPENRDKWIKENPLPSLNKDLKIENKEQEKLENE
jgi:hypothetical protein